LLRRFVATCYCFVIILISVVAEATSLAAALPKNPTATPLRINYDGGGRIGTYMSRSNALRMSGQHVIIDGTCASACTILLGVIPRDRICVTPKAVLAFHAAWDLTLTGARTSRPATLYLWAHYPDSVRRWISRHGGLRSETIYLRWPEVASLFPVCR